MNPVDALSRVIEGELLFSVTSGTRHLERALPGRAVLRQGPEVRGALSALKSDDLTNLRRDDLSVCMNVLLRDERETQEFLRRQNRAIARQRA